MAIKVFDGFDNYSSLQDLQQNVGAIQWSDIAPGESGTVSFVTGRGGYGRAVAFDADSSHIVQMGGSLPAYYTEGFFGVAVLAESVLADYEYIDVQIMDYFNVHAQLTFRFIADGGTIGIYNGDPLTDTVGAGATYPATLLGQSAPNSFSPYIWNFIEVGATIGSSGSYTVRVNGATVYTGTGNTQNPYCITSFSGIRIRPAVATVGSGQPGLMIDDFYFCDATTGPGTYPANTFLGDSAVRTLNTTANVSVSWTPLASTNWVEVGESQFDGDTSYNSANTVGNSDKFTFGALPSTVVAVYAVQTKGAYRKQDAGSNTVSQTIVSSGAASSGGTHVLSLGYGYYTDLFVTDPNTGTTFTPAAVNALEAGYTLTS